MSKQLITASYSDAITVNFTADAWFNATVVAKNFNKKPIEWLRLDSTNEYIKSLVEIQKWENPTFEENQLFNTKKGAPENGGGSWFHPKLAIAFARWLDVKFSIWCDMQVEKILRTTQYGLKAIPAEPLQKTRKALPGCLSLDTQDEIKQLIQDRAAELPKDKQAGFCIAMWSALVTHFGIKKEKGDKLPAYKRIPEGARLECLSLIARLSVDDLVTLTREEFNAAIAEQAKALPAPDTNGLMDSNQLSALITHEIKNGFAAATAAKTGEVMAKDGIISITLTPLEGGNMRRWLLTQGTDGMLLMIPITPSQDVVDMDELKRQGHIFLSRDGVSADKLVMEFMPARFLLDLIEAASKQLKTAGYTQMMA